MRVQNLEELGGIDIGPRDDRLDHGLAVWALARACRLEGVDGLVEREAVCDQRFEVD